MNSTNPFDSPIINPNLLGTSADLAIMREAVKAARAFVAAPTWSNYILGEFGAFANATTEAALDGYIRSTSDTIDHPVGTVAMGNGTTGALDSHLKVKGTVGLRVVDASAFVSGGVESRRNEFLGCLLFRPQPFIPSGHTQGPTYILAERAAHLVRTGS